MGSFRHTSNVERAPILLGTSSFTATGWEGSFYPRGPESSDYLSFYADHFDSVEVDSTFYACPSAKTVSGWFSKNAGQLHLPLRFFRMPHSRVSPPIRRVHPTSCDLSSRLSIRIVVILIFSANASLRNRDSRAL